MADEEPKRPTPPYLPYKTFRTFVDSLRQGVPGRIDRSLMRTFSGAGQSAMLQALRFLGLINDSGVPQDRLTRLASSEGAERQQVLKDMLRHAYDFMFTDDFDLTKATAKQFED